MSEPIPESIPTSSDKTSHRAAKKLRPNNPALSSQAAQISSLMSNPEIPLTLPSPSTSTSVKQYQPPEIVPNVQGSSAGAGSGEFHVYKASRRREYERLRGMEEEARKEREDEEWARRVEEKKEREEREREKNRAKRARKKGKQGKERGVEKGDGKMECDEARSGQKATDGDEKENRKHNSGGRGVGLNVPQRQRGTSDQDPGGGGVLHVSGLENPLTNKSHQPDKEETAAATTTEIGVIIHDDD